MKKALGITIGIIGVALATVQFIKTYEAGEPNWQYPILAFGMCFILYYTLLVPKKRRKK